MYLDFEGQTWVQPMFDCIFKEITKLIISEEKSFFFFQKQENIFVWIIHFLQINATISSAKSLEVEFISDLTSPLKEWVWQLLSFFDHFFSPQHKLLLQEVGGAFGSSLTFLWTKYIKSLLLRRLKSCNSGWWQGHKGHTSTQHQSKAGVWQF